MPKHAQNEPNGIPAGPSTERARHAAAEGAASRTGEFTYRGDNEDEYPDAFDSLEPQDTPPLLFDEEVVPVEPPKGKHGKQPKQDIPPYQRKSRRMRKILIAIIVLLVVLLGALAYYTYSLFETSQTLAAQQSQERQGGNAAGELSSEEMTDASTATEKRTEVPDLVSLLGKTQDEAIALLKRGATVTSTREVKEEGNPIKNNVTVALTDEPADTRSGTPTVYLGLGEDGKIVQAGYSAATAALGYGSLSFVDAIKNDHIIEKTLKEAGIDVAEGTVEVPEDKTAYTTYASDGKTVVKENTSFEGSVDINGAAHTWSAMLLYDYTTANTTGNLADTVRYVYVYINA
ncbi:hypothetical protein [Eggerthella sp. YY7918]|uniref:hypothetical protein n=1 Tax=Eggerthella sp. (strain YY7918) TaxID=502558 RepID=UPI00021714BC|nr:hypothetical protein [Eggerthella sp. YY7918]BAK44330.1 hypothetical protein EGYY_11630 [Eggerthella sp. YY7918]